MSNINNTAVIIGLFALVVVIANLAEQREGLRSLVFGTLLALNVVFVYTYGFYAPANADPPISIEAAMAARFISAIVGIFTTLALFPSVRRWLARLLPQHVPSVSGSGFDPDSPVHMTALVFCGYLFASTVLDFVLAGGMTGLASELSQQGGFAVNSQVLNMVVFIMFALLGVGIVVRRPPLQALERLGLRAPTPRELLIGIGTALLMIGIAIGVGFFWEIIVGEDTLQQQTQVSALLSQSITTLGVALIISSTAAIGEEIAFRGALQPIFGVGVTSIFFALVHIQYTLTPASLIIVVVGFALGMLRQRYNTTTSIVAHFVYNYGQMFALIWVRYAFAKG
ncbi:MAG: CPBP family intramembrane metalloprotease [Anaerolineae bacterium]|nr:CPBP family intramembrane metalloprotease [Anaerolineae bacterium]